MIIQKIILLAIAPNNQIKYIYSWLTPILDPGKNVLHENYVGLYQRVIPPLVRS